MSTYVISDIHGNYNAYMDMLKKIQFDDDDILYILGDILDRGPNPIQIILDVMKRPNVEVLAGNHCVMALECLSFLLKEITQESLVDLDSEMFGKLLNWRQNGASTTLKEFLQCDKTTQRDILAFISELDVYDEIEVAGKTYILVHAGLGNFSLEKQLWEYELNELVWDRPDYEKMYFYLNIFNYMYSICLILSTNTDNGYSEKQNQP